MPSSGKPWKRLATLRIIDIAQRDVYLCSEMQADSQAPHMFSDRSVTVLEIVRRIHSEKNFDELLNIMAAEAAKLVDAERATIFLLDADRRQMWAKIALGTSEVIRFDEGKGIAGAVMKTGKTMIVDDAYNSPLFYPEVDSTTGFRTRNILCVPISDFKREVIGVFQVLNKRDGKFSPEDARFVEDLASQAAVALGNARQLTELQIQHNQLVEENQTLRRAVEERFSTRSILGTTKLIDGIRSLIDKVAATDVSVLITGENGTGKELAAQAIHFGGSRGKKPFVAVNCAALPESLVEAELFGIEKGVATGVERRMGRIESASGGTLFLDEIGDLSLTAQAKLLRVLQEREVEWVGGRKPVPVDVRLIAATNKDLAAEIEANRFRQDLFYRINTVHVIMPSLREMRGDIPFIATHFLHTYASELGGRAQSFAADAMRALVGYDWPGNVRELQNQVKRAVVLCTGEQIELDDLPESIRDGRLVVSDAASSAGGAGELRKPLKDRVTVLEIQMVRQAMSEAGGDRRRAAKILGLSHQGLINKIKRYGEVVPISV